MAVFKLNPISGNLDLTSTVIVPPGTVATLSGDVGGSVSPSGGDILLEGGTGITITGVPASNKLIIDATVATLTWTRTAGPAVSMTVNNGYIPTAAGLVTFTLPALAALGDVFEIIGEGAGGWKIAQNASQSIRYGASVATTGAAGSIASINRYDTIQITCTALNTTFSVTKSVGVLNLT